jgi:DNA-binding response OmpR family regulator
LGEYSGLSLVELVRRKSPHTVFILITGQDKLDADLEATKNDVDEYILKPIQPNELIHKIKIHLEKQMLTKKLSQK